MINRIRHTKTLSGHAGELLESEVMRVRMAQELTDDE